MTFIFIYIFNIVNVTFDILLLTLLGHVTTFFMKFRIRFAGMVKIVIHSLTLPIILNLVCIIIELFTSFKIKYFEVMYIGVAYIYIIAALSMIRVEIIKNKQELLSIMEEQKRVKEDLERKEKEKKEQEEKQREEERKEKDKNKDKKEEDKPNKEEPQGEGT